MSVVKSKLQTRKQETSISKLFISAPFSRRRRRVSQTKRSPDTASGQSGGVR